METKAMVLVQNPIIQHSLHDIGKKVRERLAAINAANQVANEETIGAMKKMRAELNAEARVYEAERKAIKDAIMLPFNEFEAIYKSEIIEHFKATDEILKAKINSFEMTLKTDRRKALEAYFDELSKVEGIDWLPFSKLNIDVNLSTSEKKYKEHILETVGKIVDDLKLINSDEFAAEILVEYKKTLNASQSITLVRQRKEAEKQEQQRIKRAQYNVRTGQLLGIAFVSSDIAKTYYFVGDNSVTISIEDIENLTADEWMKRFADLEARTKQIAGTEVLHRPIETQNPKPETPPQNPKPEIFKAVFEVTGTMAKLTTLGAFLKENNYSYKNL